MNLAGAGGAEEGGGGHGRRRSTISAANSAAGLAGDRFGFEFDTFWVFDWGLVRKSGRVIGSGYGPPLETREN